ncbi:MAG: cofactor-independent phosphoglycerate mutase [Candidatus Mycalebacterium zealandia]|nr:MAG: cofactor-independent phosphoglycerate mutase [Candidatus Mycalebacterium zealandia]
MKYLILQGDGMPDMPLDEIGGKTPLEAANTPNLDFIAQNAGMFGETNHIPPSLPPGSDVGNLSVLGYDPTVHFTGRSPLEAAGMGISLKKTDLTCRCNLVTLRGKGGKAVMEDYSAGHIPTEQSRKIIKDIARALDSDGIKFLPGVSYRHLLIIDNGKSAVSSTPPHDILGKEVADFLPKGADAAALVELMRAAKDVLKDHPVNREREKNGESPATDIWLWGEGTAPALPSFEKTYGVSGAVISAVDLVKGIGKCAAMEVIEVPGATGYLDTNYEGKVQYAIKSLETNDLVMIHIEATDETGHTGKTELKVRAVEDFDLRVVGPALKAMERFGDFKVLVTSDHPTPISLRTHSRDPVPFALYDPKNKLSNPERVYSEKCAAETGNFFENGWKLIGSFIER